MGASAPREAPMTTRGTAPAPLTLEDTMRPSRCFCRRLVPATLVLAIGALVVGAPRPVFAQSYDSWNKVESAAETREYSQKIREGAFEDAQRAVLERIILPQLAVEANRPTIVQVRQRMRDILTRGATAPKTFDAVNAVARDFMIEVAQDDQQDIVIRVNAMIMVGELLAADRKPWSGSVEQLAKAVADPKLPLAVRMAAMTGLARFVAEGRADDVFKKAVGPEVASIVTSPPEGDQNAVAWFVGRALDVASVTGGTPAVTAAAATILADEKADLDLRIRAAAALGRLVKPEDSTTLSTAISQIRSLATTALEQDLAAAEERRFTRQLRSLRAEATTMLPGGGMTPPPPVPGGNMFGGGGGGLFGPPGTLSDPGAFGGIDEGQPVMPTEIDKDAVPALACRRNAWRLVTLADSIKPEGSAAGGIAAVLGEAAAAAAVELAALLRREALAIHNQPDEAAVKAALAALAPPAAAAADAVEPTAPDAVAPAPTPTPGDSPGSPFGAPSGSAPPF